MTEQILLPTGGWRLWPQFSLRGPGFPADGVLKLAPGGLAVAADKFGPKDALQGPDWLAFEESFGAAAVQTAHELQRIAALPAFRAAVAWQNRAVLRSGIQPFLNWEPSATNRSSMPRQREELVAHYWQRFCVKNDTIGFFGPVGWGEWNLDQAGLTVDPGEGLIADSAVFFSSWAIDTLAKTINADPAVRRWVPPRRLSFVRLVDGEVRQPGRPPQPIDPLDAAVLARCDGVTSIADIAAAVGTDDVESVVDGLVRRRWVSWRIEVPAATYPERHLRATLAVIGDPDVRQRNLALLDTVERGRDRVQAAGTDADALCSAIAELEDTFVAITETTAQRAKGARTAPCRALVYSDARRSATAQAGSALLAELTPLALCLASARWLTNRFAAKAEIRIRAAYERLRERADTVDLASLWIECLPVPYPQAAEDIAEIQAELRRRWAEIIDAPPDARRVLRASADLAEQVRAAFDEPGRGWHVARYVSPDVLVIADDADAVRRGEFHLVLGELHIGMNTVSASLFVHQHPNIPELLDETAVDFPRPRVLPMLPKEQPPRFSARSRPSLIRPEDYLVGLVEHTGDARDPHCLNSADVLVQDRDGRLVLVLPDGVVTDALDVFGNALTKWAIDRFNLVADADHSPRITIDRTTIARETWRFAADELEFTADKSEARRFVRARQWRAEHEMPRYVFVISPAEPRPFYVDFDSPVYVNIFAKAARRLARTTPGAKLTVSEMLPNPEQVWLTDDQGQRYTSELRFIAVDQTQPRD